MRPEGRVFFPATAGKRSQHASRHSRDARAMMHAGVANWRFPLKLAAGENGIPGACAIRNFAIWQEAHIQTARPTAPYMKHIMTKHFNQTISSSEAAVS